MNRDTEARIVELEKLEAGWLDDLGLPIQRGVGDRARAVAAALSHPPRIFPTPDGGINLEWGGLIEIEVRPDDYLVYLDGQVLTDEDTDD